MTDGKHHNEAGFSLVEALVAMALLAMVSTAAIMIFSGFLAGGDGQQRQLDRLATMMRARSLLADDLAHAIIRPHGPATSQTVFEGDGGKDCFLTLVRRNGLAAQFDTRRSDIESLSYCIKDGLLIRRAWQRPNAALDTERRDIVLMKNVKRAEMRFFDGKKWHQEWFIGHADGRLFGDRSQLPPLVEVKWLMHGPSRQAQYTHKLSLPPGFYQ